MSGGHTDGPWSVEKSPPGYGVYTIAGASFRPIIITYATDLTDQQGEQRLRDASLMAAAPDLLKALELLLNDYVRLAEESGCDLIGSNWDPEVARARACARQGAWPMNAYSTRDRWLDATNHGETISEALIPWANLRDILDADADALRSRWAANQVGYFEERENG